MNQEKKNRYLLFGGTGSLGNALVGKIIAEEPESEIYNCSRDEWKQWDMQKKIPRVKHYLCDVGDKNRVKEVILQINPTYIIIASALKHVDRCEFQIKETLRTNTFGALHILSAALELENRSRLKAIVFVSTDKACQPLNVYGMSKAIAERTMVEYALKNPKFKCICVRYGNVVNSRGSIIPILLESVKNRSDLNLTHEKMTRFIMTLEQSVNLIWYALHEHPYSGDTIIPSIQSAKMTDLFTLYSEKYNLPIRIVGIRPGEKLHESLISEDEAYRTVSVDSGRYYALKPMGYYIKDPAIKDKLSSDIHNLTIHDLRNLLEDLHLL